MSLKIEITDEDGFLSSAEDRAMVHLRVTAVINNEYPPSTDVEVIKTARVYLSSVIADLLVYAESTDLNLAEILTAAVSEFNDSAYRPIDITVKGAV